MMQRPLVVHAHLVSALSTLSCILCCCHCQLLVTFHEGSRGGSPRPEADDRVLSSIMHRWGSIIGSSGTSGSRLASRGRFVVRRRGAGRPLLSRWPLTPAVDVPEELVDQVWHGAAFGSMLYLFWSFIFFAGIGCVAGQVKGSCDQGAAENCNGLA